MYIKKWMSITFIQEQHCFKECCWCFSKKRLRIIYISWKHRVSFDAFCTSLDFLVVASLMHFIFHCLQFPCIPIFITQLSWSIFTVFSPLTYIKLCYFMSVILFCGLPSFCKRQSTFSKNIPVNGFSFNGCEWQLGSSSTTTSQRTIKYDPAKLCIH